MQALYDAHKDNGFVVLAVSTDQGGIETVQKYMQDLELTFPAVHDASGKVAGEYGVRGVPMTFFIDGNGKALGGVVGPREWDNDDFHALVEMLLAETEMERESATE